MAGVIVRRNALYGTCSGGGLDGQGVVFRVTASGEETLLLSFARNDGFGSRGRLKTLGNDLYGTLGFGGGPGNGTIFRYRP
jgi:uncharacterized repeat protein (TIGR03803 family)